MAADLKNAIIAWLDAQTDDFDHCEGCEYDCNCRTRPEMLAILRTVVDYAAPGAPFPGDSRDHAEKAIDAEVEAVLAHVLGLIGEGLGIEAADDQA